MVFVRTVTASSLLAVLLLSPSSARADAPPTFADRADEDTEDADRRFGFFLDPLSVAIGVYGAEGDVVLGDHLALGLQGAVYARGPVDPDGETGVATAIGAGLLVYPRSAFHGFYAEPQVLYAHSLSHGLASFDWTADAAGAALTAGWQWTWDYGFSLRVGGGAAYFASVERAGDRGVREAVQPVVDGSLGWVF